jgi:hypothetical protein
MWMTVNAAEVVQAVSVGSLEETQAFDAKRDLPGKNLDIAIDVCAMTVDGGSLLYGVGEDQNKRLTIDAPFVLAGVPEKIDQVVQTSIAEPPIVQVRALPDSPMKSAARCGFGVTTKLASMSPVWNSSFAWIA